MAFVLSRDSVGRPACSRSGDRKMHFQQAISLTACSVDWFLVIKVDFMVLGLFKS